MYILVACEYHHSYFKMSSYTLIQIAMENDFIGGKLNYYLLWRCHSIPEGVNLLIQLGYRCLSQQSVANSLECDLSRYGCVFEQNVTFQYSLGMGVFLIIMFSL